MQLKDSEFSGVCEGLLRNYILLESLESAGIKVFQYLGTETEDSEAKLFMFFIHI